MNFVSLGLFLVIIVGFIGICNMQVFEADKMEIKNEKEMFFYFFFVFCFGSFVKFLRPGNVFVFLFVSVGEHF